MIGGAVTGVLFLNEVRRRVITRVFGVSPQQANVVTAVAVGLLAEELHTRAAGVLRARPHLSIADTAIGAAALKETAHGVAGPWSRTVPFFGTLITFAVLTRWFGPVVLGSIQGVRGALRGVATASRRILALLDE